MEIQIPHNINDSVPGIGPLLETHFAKLQVVDPIKLTGRVTRSVGVVIESKGPSVSVGDVCNLVGRDGAKTPLEVIGFRENTVLSMPLGQMPGVRAGDAVVATGTRAEVAVG